MTLRSRSISLAVSAVMILSMGLTSIVSTASAAGSSRVSHAHTTKAKSASKSSAARCKTKNKQSGTVTFSDWEFPDSLNEFQTTEAVSFAVINAMQDSLDYFDQNSKLRPGLLTTLPSTKNGGILNGGKTIILHLKSGTYWSNGKELTAQDVKFSWQVNMDKATGPNCAALGCDFIGRIDTKGKYQLTLRMKQVYGAILTTGLSFYLVPSSWPGAWSNDPHAAAVKLTGDASFNYESPSYPTNGAFQVTQFSNNDRIVLKPMKYYTDMTCGAKLKQLIFSFYSQKTGMIAAAAAGQTDVTGLGGGYTAADLPLLKQHTGTYKLNSRSGFNYEFLEMNHDPTYNGKPNPISNANVRVALALALDKRGLIQSSLGVNAATAKGYEAWTPWVNTPTLVQPFANKSVNGQWDPEVKKFVEPGTAQALADAKKLLATTPYKDGFSVDFYTTSGNPVRQASEAVIAASWHKINVSVNANYVPASKLFADWDHQGILDHGAFQVSLHGFSTTPEPDGNRSLFQTKFIDRRAANHTALNQNSSGVSDKLIDRDFDTAAHTLNSTVRKNNYYAIQVEIDKLAHWIMLYYKPVTITWKPSVSPVYNNPTSCQVTCNVYAWAVKS